MSASNGVVAVGEGAACPTDDIAFECSGHGTCDCRFGSCSCDSGISCYDGDACSDICGAHGACNATANACSCAPFYDPDSLCRTCDSCHAGPSSGCLAVSQLCNLHGTCQVQADKSPLCVCDPGWGGMGCTTRTAPTVAQVATTGAEVAVPLALIAAALGVLFYRRRKGYSNDPRDLIPAWASRGSRSVGEPVVVSSMLFGGTPGKSEGSRLNVSKSYGAA